MFPVLAHYVAAYASYLNSVMMIIYTSMPKCIFSIQVQFGEKHNEMVKYNYDEIG